MGNMHYEYEPKPLDIVHRKIAAMQICAGMKNTDRVQGSQNLRMLPKHIDHIQLWASGAQEWGIHAIQG
jgi:hypothetical protein